MTLTRWAREGSDCRNLEGGGQRSPQLAASLRAEGVIPAWRAGEGEQTCHLHWMPVSQWWCHLSAHDKDPMKENSQEFLILLHSNENRQDFRDAAVLTVKHLAFIVFLVHLNFYPFDLWHTFLWMSAWEFFLLFFYFFSNPVRVKLQWTLRYICFILFVCPHIFSKKSFFSFLACRASSCSKVLDGCSYCYGSPTDKRRQQCLIKCIINA